MCDYSLCDIVSYEVLTLDGIGSGMDLICKEFRLEDLTSFGAKQIIKI